MILQPPASSISTGVVGRAIFQSNNWKKTKKGNAPAAMFRDKKSPIKISVHILNRASDKTLTKIADAIAKQRGPKCSFYGWSELPVIDASRDDRTVRPSPISSNKWHADIVLPTVAKRDQQNRERHIEQLALIASQNPARPRA